MIDFYTKATAVERPGELCHRPPTDGGASLLNYPGPCAHMRMGDAAIRMRADPEATESASLSAIFNSAPCGPLFCLVIHERRGPSYPL
jgi:hypothetical protein